MFAEPVRFNKELARNDRCLLILGMVKRIACSPFTSQRKHIPEMPEDMVQTFLMKILPVQELISPRQQCKFTNREPEYLIVPNLLAEC